MTLSLDAQPDPHRAAEACRLLIQAYAVDPQHVDWADVQDALGEALAAFDLPPDYFDVAALASTDQPEEGASP
jgi:hypothetical protein